MSSSFSLSEQFLSPGGRDQQLNMFTNNCLKRKLETVNGNGFAPAAGHELGLQGHEWSLQSEKRQRFSDHSTHVLYDANRQEMCTADGGLNYHSTVNNGDICSTINHNNENNVGADSLLQNNLECHTSNGVEEIAEMDFECESVDTSDCPPNSNEESSPDKGSPAREFLLKHRPEYQMHCIPSYCHPGGLWDVMLEVYHGL